MPNITLIPGIENLWAKTTGDSRICVAVLDGLVDSLHPCFAGADLIKLPTLVTGEATATGSMSVHGTHVTSVIFGQPNSVVSGVAPNCRGLIIPVFPDSGRKLSQLDLSRAIEQAVSAGAHIINISGGQLTNIDEADGFFSKAVQLCNENNVLIVAAAGNDGCKCLHVPAAFPTVLAVGAMDEQGKPLDFSNWGYEDQGILAPGENILGAKPGGGTVRLSGTSFATPIVTGVAALLLSLQLQLGDKPDPHKVRTAILSSALPCTPPKEQSHCLAGRLNIPGAVKLINGEKISPFMNLSVPQFSPSNSANSVMSNNRASYITANQAKGELADAQLVYALGTLGYDFGSEARRDSFKQLMPAVEVDNTGVSANPYDARQMVDYLENNLSEARSLIWTLNLELTTVYAIEPVGAFARDVYAILQELLAGQIQAETSEDYVERVSIPGILTGRTVKLFSGQVVPVIEPHSTRGLYGWKVNTLINAALATVRTKKGATDDLAMRRTFTSFLNRIYYDFRNLGTTSQDRALNFAATNAFQAASTFSQAVAMGMELANIDVEKSPFCRPDSDCWDVKLVFFDPENTHRAKRVFRFTIDVSDITPVTLGNVKVWSMP